MMKEFIKSNKAINFFKSNLIRDTDEILTTARGGMENSIKGIKEEIGNIAERRNRGPLTLEDYTDLNIYKSQLNMYKEIENLGKFNTIKDKEEALRFSKKLNKLHYNQLGENGSSVASKLQGVSDYYFGSGVGKTQKATRLGVTGAGIIGVGIGARYLSGGGMTYNSKGESDIAMIPFI